MSQIKLRNKPSRSPFDLSKRNLFSAKIGELLPVYCKEVLPGDKFDINVRSFTRTMPVNTAAFTRIKEYYDWFFVPTNLLWNKFNSFVTQMTDNVQHATGLNSTAQVTDQQPYFNLMEYLMYLKNVNTKYGDGSSAPQAGSFNQFGYNRAELTDKLMDYLDYGSYMDWVSDGASIYDKPAQNVALNPFPLLAYQKIYYDYFRNSQWENSNAPAFNVDYLSGDDLEINVTDLWSPSYLEAGSNMFDLRYANWHKDLFTGLLPNSQYGDAASVMTGGELPNIPSTLKYTLGHLYNNADTGTNDRYLLEYTSDQGLYLNSANTGTFGYDWRIDNTDLQRLRNALIGTNMAGAFSVLALRQAEALQRWKEITQSQQQDYAAQIEAHFGVNVSNALSERCHWIDGFDNVIDINEVVNTNLVSGDTRQSADIAGKGVGVQDGHTSFNSQVHGYIMCIYHAEPLLDYSFKTRIARQNLKTYVTDYAIPELDKTGMVSVPMIELTNAKTINSGPNNVSQLLGYAPRYYDYKTDVDTVKGSLRQRNSAWVAPFDDEYLREFFDMSGDINGLAQIDYSFFKINPAILDPIFVSQIYQDGVADVSVDTDQLITNCSFQIHCVRNLDRDGLPY